MNFLESIKTALKNIFSNKMRAFLTMLGIIIGIGSVIIITSIGSGSQASMNEQFEEMGFGKMQVFLSGRNSYTEKDLLTDKDIEAIEKLSDVKAVSGQYSIGGLKIKLLDPKETKNVQLQGVTAKQYEMDSPKILYGRYIDENDISARSKVAVITDTTAGHVFGKTDSSVIGEKIQVKTTRGTQKYTVIGLIEDPNAEFASMFGDDFPQTVILPSTTLHRLAGTEQYDTIYVAVSSTDKMTDVAAAISSALDNLHGTTDNYYVQNPMNMLDQMNSMTSMITLFIAAVAGISLVVGGIGVMNIMLVTVTERTREIGIRKSIGAKNKDIRIQFLIEAVILTAIGGIVGIIFGIGGGVIVGKLVSITPIVSMPAVVFAVSVSSLIGIIFGVWPANKAAKLDPIEALRYE